MSVKRLAALALAASLAATSCQTVGVRDTGTPLDPADGRARALLDGLISTRDRPTGLRAAARLSLETPEVRISRPQRIAVERPAKLRVEVIGLFGQVAGVVATDGEHFGFVDLLSGRREQGRVDDGLLWRTARVDLTPTETVDLVLGAPRMPEASSIVEARAYRDGGVGMLVAEPDRVRRRWVELDGQGRLRRIELRDADGSALWVARYTDWRDIEGVAFAHGLDLEFPRVLGRARIRFDAVALDPDISPEVFVLQVPPGSKAGHQ